MRQAMWIATCWAAIGVLSCGGSEPANGSGQGGAAGTGGASGSGGAAGSADGGASEDAGGDRDGGVTASEACSAMASALCAKLEACAPLAVTILFGDMPACMDVAKTACNGSLQAAQTAATPGRFMTCSRDLQAAQCASVLSHDPPPSCRPQGGTVGNGMACGDDWQCASGRCAIPSNATCGVCASLAPAGGACPNDTDDECAFGLVCADNLLCVAPGQAGASCDANHPCASPLVCAGATMTAQGTCAIGGALGDACTSDQGCSFLDGLWCNRAPTRACAKIAAVDPGMRCGFVDMMDFVLCKGGGAGGGCVVTPGTAMGTCPRLGMPGDTCSATARCKVGAVCVNGLCTVREPASCR